MYIDKVDPLKEKKGFERNSHLTKHHKFSQIKKIGAIVFKL